MLEKRVTNSTGKYIVGIDESNHGKFPEIFVATYSPELQLGIFSDIEISKVRNHSNINSRLREIDYTFLLLQREDLDKILERKKKGSPFSVKSVVIPSLMQGLDLPCSQLEIFVDGDMKVEDREFTREFVSGITKLPMQDISLRAGTRYDEHFRIINYADQLANYLFRKGLIEGFNPYEYNKRKRELILTN